MDPIAMTEADEYHCRLLADLLPACLELAHFFASDYDTVARSSVAASTFYQNLYCEFRRLQAGQVSTYDRSLTVLGVGVIPVLEMLEERTRSPLRRPWSRKGTFKELEALRSEVVGQNVRVKALRQKLCLSARSQTSRKHIIKSLENCNPEGPPYLQSLQVENNRLSSAKASKSPVVRVSRGATRSHQLLCKNWACACVPPGSHVAARLLLTTYQSNKITNTTRFELFLSTSDKNYPWRETEIDIAANTTSNVEEDAAIGEQKKRGNTRDEKVQVLDRKVQFTVDAREPKDASPKRERWKVENICVHIHKTLGTRFRLLVEGNSLWRLRPARPKFGNLGKAVYISLSDLIQNGDFLQRTSQIERFILTYTIANSILSLYQGPWLDHDWTKDQILFPTQAGDLTTFDLSKPLLSTKCIATGPACNQADPDHIHPEPRIAALGIVMLEIALGKTIESRRDDAPLNSNTDLLNAYELLDQLQQKKDALSGHISAIKTCLQPEDNLEEDFSNESTQESLHANIVGPLEKILTFYGIKIEDLDSSFGGDGGDHELPLQKPTRSVLETRNSSTQFLGSVNPVESHSEDAGLSSISAEEWFQDLKTHIFPLFPEAPVRRVKIAILDSGIDLPNEVEYAYENRITYRSWIEGDDTKGTDISGHGTHAAGLLLKVSPHAEIYVARITKKGETDPDIIAKAINFAVDVWKVDIITFSFGFHEVKPIIDRALTYAVSKNTILFGAASNSGNRRFIQWPARAEQVICIHSLDGNGDHSSYTPNSRPQDYGILGQAVSSYWPLHFNAGIEVLKSGTSSAAPIAAGVAALVLEYTQHKLPLYAQSQSDKYVIQKLSSNAGMRMVFGLMAESRGGYNCVTPWTLLNPTRKEYTVCGSILEKLRNL